MAMVLLCVWSCGPAAPVVENGERADLFGPPDKDTEFVAFWGKFQQALLTDDIAYITESIDFSGGEFSQTIGNIEEVHSSPKLISGGGA